MKTISILLADDHTVVRKGIRSLLEKLPDLAVAGEANNGSELLDLLAQQSADVVLMDIGMPVMNGIKATSRIRADFPGVRVLILSMHDTEDYLAQALRAGCSGFVLKEAAIEELEFAIRAVARGQYYVSPAISKFLVEDYLKNKSREFSPLDKLTPRQLEILQLVAEGQTSAEIAAKLSLSLKTVEAHRAEMMSRLQIHDVAGLTRFAIRFGIVTA